MPASVLDPAGPAAALIAQIGWALFIGAALIFALVLALVALALRRDAQRVKPALWIVGGGVIFPVVVLSFLLAADIAATARLTAAAPAGAMQVAITGHMWWWEVRYRDPASGDEVVLANELRLPVGAPVQVGLTSGDVIHSFWVPVLAGKVDMVPGRVNRIVVSAERAGTWRGPCAEYCGTQHARMTLAVVAIPPAEFDAWLRAQAQGASAPTDALAERGRRAFVELRCGACHRVRGVAESPVGAAPDLTHVGSRLTLGAGTLRNSEAALMGWIASVQQHKPHARMPSFDALEPEQLQALAAYLWQLK